jgi:hypothetical protein
MSDIHNQREIENLQAEIKRLRADNERLREALEPFAKAAEIDPEQCFAYGGIWSAAGATGYISVAHLRLARATLEGRP